MKFILKKLLNIAALFLVIYLLFAFNEWNLNAAQWEKQSRVFCSITVGVFMVLIAAIAGTDKSLFE